MRFQADRRARATAKPVGAVGSGAGDGRGAEHRQRRLKAARHQKAMGPLLIAAVVLGLLGLPLAVWLDLRVLSERILRAQAGEIGRIIDDIRGFYGNEIVSRVLNADGHVTVTHNFRSVPGAIPIPATLSLELGKLVSAHDGSVKYRFVSDYPFVGPGAAQPRLIRTGGHHGPPAGSSEADHPGVRLGLGPQRPGRVAGPHGGSVRALPQHAP